MSAADASTPTLLHSSHTTCVAASCKLLGGLNAPADTAVSGWLNPPGDVAARGLRCNPAKLRPADTAEPDEEHAGTAGPSPEGLRGADMRPSLLDGRGLLGCVVVLGRPAVDLAVFPPPPLPLLLLPASVLQCAATASKALLMAGQVVCSSEDWWRRIASRCVDASCRALITCRTGPQHASTRHAETASTWLQETVVYKDAARHVAYAEDL